MRIKDFKYCNKNKLQNKTKLQRYKMIFKRTTANYNLILCREILILRRRIRQRTTQ